MQTTRFRRTVAGVAAATIALAGLAFGALPANAAPTIPGPDETANLTIHKFEYDGVDRDPSNGLQQDTTGLTAMADILFQVQQVPDIDLSTNAGWQAAGSLTPAQAQADVDDASVTPIPRTTAADGTAFFEDLPIGLYLVTEVLTPEQIASGITAIDSPFLVTLPLTHPTDLDTWIYDVHVYPKNRVSDAPVKTVSDNDGSTLAVGDSIDWTITSQIPAGELTAYGIRDVLSDSLEHTGTAVSVTAGDIALVADDYVVVPASSANDNTVRITFTEAGLVKLAAIHTADASVQIQVVLTTTVTALPGNGIVPNSAAVFPNDSYDIEDPDDPGVPSEEVESRFGNLVVTKLAQGTATALAGAEFRVYPTQADAEEGTNEIVPTGATTPWVTGSDGTVTITGLRASNWANGQLLTDEGDFQTYWLVETKAPEGYELLADPIEFTVLSNGTDVLALGEADVINVPENAGFELPLTGGAGTAIFTIVGLGLVGIAAVVLVRSRKSATE